MLAVLADFFCLLFFAAAKKSRCRPAQGRRVKREGKSRMPAKEQTKPSAPRSQTANASENAKRGCQRKHKQSKPTRPRREGATLNPLYKQILNHHRQPPHSDTRRMMHSIRN